MNLKMTTAVAVLGNSISICGLHDTRARSQYKETRAMDRQDRATQVLVRRRGFMSAAAVVALAGVLVVGAARHAEAQFNSGSSGIHGPFPPVPQGGGGIPSDAYFIVWNVRTGLVRYCSGYTVGTGSEQCDNGSTTNVTAQIPGIPSGGLTTGIYEFTDVSILPLNGQRFVVPVGYSPNVPLSILSQGDINIPAGNNIIFYLHGYVGRNPAQVNFSVAGGKGGPGGFDGGASGNGGSPPGNGNAGFGPSGGAGGNASASAIAGLHADSAAASPLNPSLTPLSGGSGGGGAAGHAAGQLGCESNPAGYGGGSGGGGGGALLLAASGRVTLGSNGNTQILATGGNGGQNSNTSCRLWGGGGAGGSVRIVAQEFVGSGTINVAGGTRADGSTPAGGGRVRIEAALNTFTGTISGASGGSFLSFTTAAVPSNLPLLRITTINGAAAPASPAASLAAPDITFAQSIDTPVTLEVTANNVPTGTTVNIKVVPATGAPTTATTSGLAGSLASSTATATVTLPPGAGIVTATATFNVGSGQGAALSPATLPLIDGERPQRVEVVAMADGTSRTYLLSRTGARFELGQTGR
jgi:hypothetical protein